MIVFQSILISLLPVLMTIYSKNLQQAGSLNQSILALRKVLVILYPMEVRIMMKNLSKYIWNRFKRLNYGKLKSAEPLWRMNINQISILRKILCARTWSKCCLKRTLGELANLILLALWGRHSPNKLRIKKRRNGLSRVKKQFLSISFHSLKNFSNHSWFLLRSTMTRKN